MERTVRVIPAKKQSSRAAQSEETPKTRVAAYCRVSTDSDEQATSYEAQVEHYTKYIMEKPEWELAGIYADDGISGTNTKKRDDFNRMIDDCLAGKIDMVITKSISRFARNTLDCLKFIRQLKEREIPVFFEKENINTMDSKGEVLLTIMASLAQQESQSMSANVRMGYSFRFQEGKVMVNHSRFLGYTKDQDGNLVVIPEEAETVKRIFREYLDGASLQEIARGLERDGKLTGAGLPHWRPETIRKMLQNEKYMGDALLQKTYTVDYLSKRKVINEGIAPQYYVENSHEAIIPKDLFLLTQEELRRRTALTKEHRGYSSRYALSGIVECACCGANYRRIKWNNRGCKSTVWRCASRLNKKTSGIDCSARTVVEEDLHKAVISAINEVMMHHDSFFEKYKKCLIDGLRDDHREIVGELSKELEDKQRLLIKMADNDPGYDILVNEIVSLREQRRKMIEADVNRRTDQTRIDLLIESLNQLPASLTEYDDKIVRKMVERVVVSYDGYEITLKNGLSKFVEK